MTKPKHDHRRSLHVLSINGTHIYWCYRCGAIRCNDKWTRPTGPDGENPAVTEYLRKHKYQMATRPSSLTLYDRATPQERAEIRRKTLAIPCSYCGAKAGEKCRGAGKHPAQPHEIRRRNAVNPPQPTTEQRLATLEEQVAMLRGFLNI